MYTILILPFLAIYAWCKLDNTDDTVNEEIELATVSEIVEDIISSVDDASNTVDTANTSLPPVELITLIS